MTATQATTASSCTLGRLPGEPDRNEFRRIAEANPLPSEFRFGVAIAAFQNEGGYNGRSDPKNNFFDWEETRKVETSGQATNFWADPVSHFERARDMSCNAFRLSIEWARVFPSAEYHDSTSPGVDQSALDRYAEILRLCRDHGMEPLVTLHHFTHPRWLGVDAWTRRSTVEHFIDYVDASVAGTNDRLVRAGQDPIAQFITINEPNGPGATGYFVGQFPPGRLLDAPSALRVTDSLMTAHIRAYNRIHDIYARRGWEAPAVSTNTFATWTWGLERVIPDLLLARENGVAANDLDQYFARSRRQLRQIRSEDPYPPGSLRMGVERILDWITDRIGARHFPEATAALYKADRPSCLDFISVDYYDPYLSRAIRRPGRDSGAGPRWRPVADFWEQVVNPAGLVLICRAAAINSLSKPVVIAENGLASQTRNNLSFSRQDGVTRDDYLRRHLAQIVVARDAGVDVSGYYHWTLVDNYEWGSYEPCFGLHGVDRSGDTPTITDDDALGCDAARTYGECIDTLRSGDAQRIAEVLVK